MVAWLFISTEFGGSLIITASLEQFNNVVSKLLPLLEGADINKGMYFPLIILNHPFAKIIGAWRLTAQIEHC